MATFICPRCGSPTAVLWVKSYPDTSEPIRMRRCKRCWYQFKTVEKIISEDNKES